MISNRTSLLGSVVVKLPPSKQCWTCYMPHHFQFVLLFVCVKILCVILYSVSEKTNGEILPWKWEHHW